LVYVNKLSLFFVLLFLSTNAYCFNLKEGAKVEDLAVYVNDKTTLKMLTDMNTTLSLRKDMMVFTSKDGNSVYDEQGTRNYLKYFWAGMDWSNPGIKSSVLRYIDGTLMGSLEDNGKFLANPAQSNTLTYAAYEGDELIGYISLQEEDPKPWHGEQVAPNKKVNAFAIFIKKEASGRGLGQKVAQSMVKLIKENLDVSELFWDCDVNNVASNKIAMKSGFSPANHYYDHGQSCNIYKLVLTQQN